MNNKKENWKPIKNFDNFIGKCSIKNIQFLERELVQYCTKSNYIKKNMKALKDLIQLIISYLNDGAKINDIEIFESYPKILKDLVILSSLSETQITYTIIQSLSYLLVNLDKNKSSLYYILSNNFLNEIIQVDFSKFDDEFFSFYINLLKSLSMRIDDTMLQFFYNPNYNSFPLLECANKLYNYSNAMINTVVHNVSLQLMRLKIKNIISHFSKLPTINYFAYLSCYLNDLTNLFLDSGDSELFIDMIDFLMYVNDILKIGEKTINYIFINSIFSYFILPNLCNKLTDKKKKKFVILCIIVLFNKIQDETFLNCLFMVFFNEKIHKNILDLKNNKNKPNGYCFTWKEQMKLKEKFLDYICQNYTENFLMSFWDEDSLVYKIKMKKEYMNEIDKIKSYVEKNISDGVSFEKIKNFIFSFFNNEEKNNIEKTHILWSKCLGINVGICDKDNSSSFCNDCFLFYMKNEIFNNNCDELIENKINKEFLNLMFEKDCFYYFQILIWSINNKVNLSKELISKHFSLLIKEKIVQNEKKIEKEKENNEENINENKEEEKKNDEKNNDNKNLKDEYILDNKKISNFYLNNNENFNKINLNLISSYFNLIQDNKTLSSYSFEEIEIMMSNLYDLIIEKANNILKIINLICNFPKKIYNQIQDNKKINEYFFVHLENIIHNLKENKSIEKNITSMRLLVKLKFKKIDINEILSIILLYLIIILSKNKNKNYDENPFHIYNLIDDYDINDIKNNNNNIIPYFQNNIICVLDKLFLYIGILKKENLINFETIINLVSIKNAVKKDKNNNFTISYQNSKEIVFINNSEGKKALKDFIDTINDQQKKSQNYINEKFDKEKIKNYLEYLSKND